MNRIGNYIAILLCVMIGMQTFAQDYKFGKVSIDELNEKEHPLDKDANASILYENKNVRVEYRASEGFRLVTDVHKRVKLYTKEGFDQATEEIMLYKNGGSREVLNGLKAVTYNIVNGKVEGTKLKKDGIFKNEYTENIDQHKFTMPVLQEGSVIEYKYTVVSPFLSSIDRIYLQYEIPIKRIEVKIETPEYFAYNKFSTGFLPINIKESSYNSKFTFKTEAKFKAGVGGGFQKGSSYDIDFVMKVNDVKVSNVPAFEKEPYAGNIQNYISSLTYELSFVNFPNEPVDYRATTWENVSKNIFEASSFGGELAKHKYFKSEIDPLVEDAQNEIETVGLIFNLVKTHMNWDGNASVFTRKGVKKAFQEGVGNVAEINLMLTAMLKSKGIQADPVLVSTSDRMISLFPTIDGFNYVITRVVLGDGSVFYLDATDKYGLPNILPARVIRGMGRVINESGASQMVFLRPKKPAMKRCNMQYEIHADGSIKGKMGIRYMSYQAYNYRLKKGAVTEENRVNELKEFYGMSEVEDYSNTGLQTMGKGVGEQFSFESDNDITVMDNEMFFSPLVFLRTEDNIFKSEERNYPVDFGYGYANTYMINIKIPGGYEVMEYPKSGVFKLPNNQGSFTYRSNASNGVIQVSVNETINNPLITEDYYGALKEFYNQIIQKEEEQVVLKKI